MWYDEEGEGKIKENRGKSNIFSANFLEDFSGMERFGHSKSHFRALENGHFWHFQVPKNVVRFQKWDFERPNPKTETTFISPTSPKNDGIAFGFKHLPLLERF